MPHPDATSLTSLPPSDWHDPAFIDGLRRQMLRFATQQLQDHHLAEDAVQEALMGAMKNASSFQRAASLKTWVFAILKNKIADVLRQRMRHTEARYLLGSDQEADELDELFNPRGFWQAEEQPVHWHGGDAALEQQQFWQVFEACLAYLPAQQARVFMMREFIEMETQEVCEAAGITAGNLHVILYRARLRLRECLEDRWFSRSAQP